MGIKDILDKSGLNIDYMKVLAQLNEAISSPKSIQTNGRERMRIDSNGNASFPNWQDVLMNEMEKRKLTIKNPERLNINNNHRSGEWVIEYMGRDLSLEEDNYRWDVYGKNGVRGYYIVERELVQGNWLNVRWGLTPTNVKERKELIDKSRLKDKERIQSDMIQAINSLT
jgi:uncharacterized protein YajQ (UPF0234 family)